MGKKTAVLTVLIMLITSMAITAPVTVNSGVTVNTNNCDTINWTDSSGLARSASIVRINGNPQNYKGGYISRFTYMDGASPVTINESNPAGDLSGLGFMINHVIYQKAGYTGRGWINSKQDGTGGTTTLVFQGDNHAIYETEMDIYGDDADHSKGTFKAKWMYMIRTGNDYIVDSIGYDFSSQPAGTWGHDIRSPYCELNWTGTGASNTLSESIDGVEWSATDSNGISWIFKTNGSSPFSAGYTYNTPGKGVPYTLQWKNTPDREIGYISTFDFTQQAAGGGFLSAPMNIGSTSATMPPNWGVNYQANGFQNWYGDKMTWQLPYGAAGGESSQDGTVHKSTVPDWTWRKDWPAYPTNGFTLLIHTGKKTDDNVRKLVSESSDIHSLVNPLTASTGSVVTTGKMNLYSTAGSFTLKPAGYNHIYHAWEANCASNSAVLSFALGAKSLKNQTFIFYNYTGSSVPLINVNGSALSDGTDMYCSLDDTNDKLYVTFNRVFTGTTSIELGGVSITATFTNTATLSGPTFTPTVTSTPGGAVEDCVNINIDRSQVPSMAFMKKLTLKVHVGNCDSVKVYCDTVEIPSTYDSATDICMFSAEGNDVQIVRTNYTGGALDTVTKAVLYNDKKWAYSFTFDDARPSTHDIALPIFEAKGFRGGVGLNTSQNPATTDGYGMSWLKLDTLYSKGWSFFDHNYSHQIVTCDNISTETLPVKQAIEARWPGYLCTHFVYPYVNTTNWTCIRDSGLMLSAENFTGNNYADIMPPNPFIINRNGFMKDTTAAPYNSMADNAASDTRQRWLIYFTHGDEAGSTVPGDYDTNETVLSDHINYVYNTYGAGGLDNMWFAPSDEVMHYIVTREKAVVSFVGSGTCGAIVTATPSNTATYTATATPTSSEVCAFDDLDDGDPADYFGGFWYSYASGDPAYPDETYISPAPGAASCPPAAGGAASTAYAMRMTGTVGAVNAPSYPCIGLGAQLSSDAGTPVFHETDISSCTGIRFYVKGDGKSYYVKVPYTNSSGATLTGYDDYKYVFSAPASWTQLNIPFTSFAQAGWGTAADLMTVLTHAKEFQWQTNFNGTTGSAASAELWIDQIELIGCTVCPAVPAATNTMTTTQTPVFTNTETHTNTHTFTSTNTATYTSTPSATGTFTDTITPGGPTLTFTGTFTNTQTYTNTYTSTYTSTNTPTESVTHTNTAVNSATLTYTYTSVNTPAFTSTNTVISTPTFTSTNTSSVTATFTNTYTHTSISTKTFTPSYTATAAFSNTHTITATYTSIAATLTPTQTYYIPVTATHTPDVSEALEISGILSYPCPVYAENGGDINIKFSASRAYTELNIKIYTVSSRLIKTVKTGSGNKGINTIKIPNRIIKELATGTYFYVINSEKNEKAAKIEKLIIMRK